MVVVSWLLAHWMVVSCSGELAGLVLTLFSSCLGKVFFGSMVEDKWGSVSSSRRYLILLCTSQANTDGLQNVTGEASYLFDDLNE